MDRFKFYIILLVVNIVLYVVSLFISIEYLAGIVNFLSFLGAVIFLLFTIEEPPSVSKLKIPEVHNRYRSAQNNYNNMLAFEFALLSFLFFILHYSTQLSISVAVLIVWVLSVPISYMIIILNSRDKQIEMVVDYIRFADKNLDSESVKLVVRKIVSVNSADRAVLLSSVSFSDSALLSKVVDLYLGYLSSYKNELLEGEVSEINDL